jgi:DNA mismatch repair protein MutS2
LHAQKKRISKLLTEVVRDRVLEDVVQEDYVSLRADRYVILLKPNFRGRLDGIVHDHSRSGASAYVEPLSVVEANNRVASLLDEEQGEILRIFKEVSDEIRNSGEDLEMNYALLARLDALQARARYAEETRSVAPELISEGFRIRGARHPLLLASGRDVVPMDVIQEPDTHVTVISGANMGGKTVALKIAGLFPLMARCGIMLPAREGAGIRCQGGIMADIGEEQDLLGQVSSFSSHMLRIRGILSAVRPGDLVLLDELGSATDPDEGSALAMAIIDELAARNARVVVTTHLSHLKAYALGRQDITNVSAHFDPETLQPSFRLVYDLPGESHALTTAERIGLPPDVIAAARAYADRSAGGSSQLMERLRNELMGVEQEREAATRMRKELEDRIARLESSKESILEEAGNEAQRVVKEAQKDILSLQKALKSGMPKRGDEPQQELARIRHNVERSLGRPLDRKDTAVGEGDRVRVEPLGREGVVTQMLDRDRAEIAVGNMRIRSDLKDLTVLPRSPRQKSSSKKDRIRVDMPLAVPRTEVNVIGFRVEDALPVVDKALDEALVSGLSSLLIIHGKGTGRLKQAIWDHLSDNPAVRGIAPGHHYGGGEGVSVVDLETG